MGRKSALDYRLGKNIYSMICFQKGFLNKSEFQYLI
jgi:hypothetical protein